MGPIFFDIAWRLLTWLVVLAGVGVIAHALFTDTLAGFLHAARVRRSPPGAVYPRLRCPGGWGRLLWVIPVRSGCWYDMGGALPEADGRYLCPECGRRSGLRRLKRNRHRWKLALVGVGIALVGLGGRYSRDVYRDGWKAVPDGVLVLVPFDERDWLENNLPSAHWAIQAAAVEIERRDDQGQLSPWASAYLGRRVLARCARDSDYGVDDASAAAYERLAATPFATGIDNRSFSEAVTAIAAVAGVPLDVDTEALSAVSIEPGRAITIPSCAVMSCAQALDWACDRARATRGWAYADWTLEQGHLVIADDRSTRARGRALVLLGPSYDGAARRAFRSVVARTIAPSDWNQPRAASRPPPARGDAVVAIATARRLLDARRTMGVIGAAEGFPADQRDAMLAFEERLAHAAITPVEAEETFEDALLHIRDEAGIPISVDGWGLNAYETLTEALVERGLIRIDRTAHNADPFNDNPTDEEGNPIEPIASVPDLLATFSADSTHDGQRLIVGLRAPQSLWVVCAYRIPPRPEHATTDMDQLREWLEYRILDDLDAPDNPWRSSQRFAMTEVVGDVLLVWADPRSQARAARNFEQFCRRLSAQGATP